MFWNLFGFINVQIIIKTQIKLYTDQYFETTALVPSKCVPEFLSAEYIPMYSQYGFGIC